jgi:hypothetical protein
LDPPLHTPGKEVLAGASAYRTFEESRIERVLFGSDPDQGRRGEGVPLHPVHEEGKRIEVVRAGEVVVGPVSLAIYPVERCFEMLDLYPRR